MRDAVVSGRFSRSLGGQRLKMTEIRHRLDTLSNRLDALSRTPTSTRNAMRRREHLNLLRAECDALRHILAELSATSAGAKEWIAVRREVDRALTRLESSFERAIAREGTPAARREELTVKG